jgi:hypothetical protein
LRTGIESLIADLPLSVHFEFSAPRLPPATEISAYFIVAEALTNVVKHANATEAYVGVGYRDARVVIEVSDDGCGGADAALGSGLTGAAGSSGDGRGNTFRHESDRCRNPNPGHLAGGDTVGQALQPQRRSAVTVA